MSCWENLLCRAQWGSLLSLGVAFKHTVSFSVPSCSWLASGCFPPWQPWTCPIAEDSCNDLASPFAVRGPVLLILLRSMRRCPCQGGSCPACFALTLGYWHTNAHTLIFPCKVTFLSCSLFHFLHPCVATQAVSDCGTLIYLSILHFNYGPSFLDALGDKMKGGKKTQVVFALFKMKLQFSLMKWNWHFH